MEEHRRNRVSTQKGTIGLRVKQDGNGCALNPRVGRTSFNKEPHYGWPIDSNRKHSRAPLPFQRRPPICRRILLVEDNDDIAQSLGLILARDGHAVSIAQNGAVALGLLRTFAPDIVLLDIGLPGMDGFELARRMRNESNRADLVIVALSGYGQEEHRRLSREAGCDEHLVKPTHPDVLRNLLGRIRHSANG